MRKWSSYVRSGSYRKKLFVYSILFSLVPVFILGMLSAYITSASIQEEVDNNQQIILRQLEVQVNGFVRSMDRESLQLANNQYVEASMDTGVSVDRLQSTLYVMDTIQKSIESSDVNFDVTLYYANFNQMYSSRYGIIRELSAPYNEIVETAKQRYNGVTVISPNTYPNIRELLLVRTIPLSSLHPKGYLILHLDINKLKQFIDQLDLGSSRKVLIVDDQGTVLTSRDPNDIGAKLDASSALYHYWNNPNTQGTVTWAGADYSVLSLRSSINNWTYLAMTPMAELVERANSIRFITISIMLLLSAVWLLLAVIGSRQLYRPIGQLIRKHAPEQHHVRNELQAIDTFVDRIKDTNEELQTRLTEYEPYRKEGLFLHLLRGEISDRDIPDFMQEYGLVLQGDRFCVCLIDVDQYAFFQKTFKGKERFLVMYALRNIIEELGGRFSSRVTVIPQLGQIVLIAGSPREDGQFPADMAALGKEIREQVKQRFDFTVSIVISDMRPAHSGISESYHEAMELLDYRWIAGPNKTIAASDAEPALNRSSRILVKRKSDVMQKIVHGDFAAAREQLAGLVESIPGSLNHSEGILGLFAGLLGEIDLYLHEMGYEMDNMFEYDLPDNLYQQTSLKEVHSWMANTVLTVVENYLHQHSLSRQKKIVMMMLQHIQEHYESDLSLQILADQFNVSPSRLSRMFKEETGSNYLNYLIQFRMDKAREWLVHTDIPVNEISSRLRYTSLQNFTRIFKQVTGVPPGQYRKTHGHL